MSPRKKPHELRRDQSVESARERLLQLRKEPEGAVCPCCDQHVKLYKRRLNRAVAEFVVRLVLDFQSGNPDWISASGYRLRGGDYAKALYWGLAERHPEKRSLWRPTLEGIHWVEGSYRVPRYAMVYNGSPTMLMGTEVTATDVLDQSRMDALREEHG